MVRAARIAPQASSGEELDPPRRRSDSKLRAFETWLSLSEFRSESHILPSEPGQMATDAGRVHRCGWQAQPHKRGKGNQRATSCDRVDTACQESRRGPNQQM
jgi:hypothetical protein